MIVHSIKCDCAPCQKQFEITERMSSGKEEVALPSGWTCVTLEDKPIVYGCCDRHTAIAALRYLELFDLEIVITENAGTVGSVSLEATN